jgi:hypothetical protein
MDFFISFTYLAPEYHPPHSLARPEFAASAFVQFAWSTDDFAAGQIFLTKRYTRRRRSSIGFHHFQLLYMRQIFPDFLLWAKMLMITSPSFKATGIFIASFNPLDQRH